MFDLEYYYKADWVRSEAAEAHHKICEILRELSTSARVATATISTHEAAFPTTSAKADLFAKLERFAFEHSIGLARVFGSRQYGFSYLPPQFLLAYRDSRLAHVFPCRISRVEVDLIDALERFANGEAWAITTKKTRSNREHEALVARVKANPEVVEEGLRLQGANVAVSRNFSERGFIDIVFQTRDNGYLLVEVKVTGGELDKALGQILRHRDLFIEQHDLDADRVRAAIVCPVMPASFVRMCARLGVRCVQQARADAVESFAAEASTPFQGAKLGRK